MLGAESADWWARAVAIAAAAVAAASLGWNIYTWRRTNRVSLKVRSAYVHRGPGDPHAGPWIYITIKNRGRSKVTVDDVKRRRQYRQPSRRLGGWRWQDEENTGIQWPTTGRPTYFPLDIPAGDTMTLSGIDEWLGSHDDTNTRWTFRVVLDSGQRFQSRPSMRRSPDGKIETLWPRRTHRVRRY